MTGDTGEEEQRVRLQYAGGTPEGGGAIPPHEDENSTEGGGVRR